MKIFQTVVKKIQSAIGGSGGGGLTFRDLYRRIEGLTTRLSVTEVPVKRADIISSKIATNDLSRRTDITRIPSISAAIIDSSKHRDSIPKADTKISESLKKTDKPTGRIEYQTVGTYTFIVPNGVTSLILEGEGGGGGGGASGATFGGGGGGGGGNGVLTQAVTAGDTITVVIPNTSAGGATGGSCTFARNGTNIMTVTGGSPGSAGQATAGGAGGAGGTATGTGVTATAGSTGSAGALTTGGAGGKGGGAFGGAGGAAATAGTAPGGGGGGAGTVNAAAGGARGGARITF